MSTCEYILLLYNGSFDSVMVTTDDGTRGVPKHVTYRASTTVTSAHSLYIRRIVTILILSNFISHWTIIMF